MGNMKNRAPRRKNRFRKLNRKTMDDVTSIKKTANNNITTITTDNPVLLQPTVVVDVVSILSPISDVQYKHNYTLDPITPSSCTENRIKNVQYPLFVVKSETKSPSTSNEYPNIMSSKATVLAIEPKSSEEEQNPIAFENHQCRLCLTKEGTNWIDIFSSKPYPFSNVHEIKPSNIVEIIEQSTTVKISKDDRLPDKLCLNCFQSLRFIYKFREKSLRSQNVLTSEVNPTSEQNPQMFSNGIQLEPTKLVKVIHLKRILKPFPKPTKRLSFEEAYNVDMDEEKYDVMQCEICGEIFEKYKPFQYHLNRHHDVRPFACTEPYCDKSFNSPQNRKNHILNVHSIDHKFKCDLCDKKYNKAEKLTYHRATHFPPTIPCTVCGKLLRSQASVRKHRASHAERLYRCDDCGKSFQNSYTLRVHRRIHGPFHENFVPRHEMLSCYRKIVIEKGAPESSIL